MNQANGGSILYKFIGDDKNLNNTIKGVNGALKGVASAAGAMGAGVLAATTAVGGALMTITKQSVQLYGEMEQLAGGAQKIFDEIDYDTIANDAKEAYRTMNLSASEYLALITHTTCFLKVNTSYTLVTHHTHLYYIFRKIPNGL
jgi:hypothetical protein